MLNLKKAVHYILVIPVVFIALIFVFTACLSELDPVTVTPHHTHQWGEWMTTIAPTCTTAGEKTRTCALNPAHTEGEGIAPDPTAHNWGNWTQTRAPTEILEGYEIGTCTYNAAHKELRSIPTLSHTHIWGSWSQTRAPSETVDGEEARICTVNAAHQETRPIAALLHTHVWGEWTETTAPTCTTEGEDARVCSLNATHTDTRAVAVVPEAHNYGDWTTTTPATCTAAGEDTRVCSLNTAHTDARAVAIEPTAHDYQWVTTTAPTCVTAGVDTGTCDHNATHTDTRATPIDPDAHNWNNSYTMTTPATCSATGIETDACSLTTTHTRTQTIAISPDAHDWGEGVSTANCMSAGTEFFFCTYNGSHTRQQPAALDSNAHDYLWTPVTAPTCTAAGSDFGSCSFNNLHTTTRTVDIDPNAHDYDWMLLSDPTCTGPGLRRGTCRRDRSHQETGIGAAALGHDWRNNWIENQPVDGMEAIRCLRDYSHIKETRVVMVFVQSGRFIMGNPDETSPYSDPERPIRNVTLTQGFYMGKYQVTQAQWQAVMGRTIQQQQALATTATTDYGRGDSYPAYYVNWYEAVVFCNKLSVMEGLTPAYRISGSTNPDDWGTVPTSPNAAWDAVTIDSNTNGYRLPTEAQWEYAAKGGNLSPGDYLYSGSNTVWDVAWYSGNNSSAAYGTKTVGTKAPNGLGIYDMSGNIWEWCWDSYAMYSILTNTDPSNSRPGGLPRIRRGGGWSSSVVDVRSTYRDSGAPGNRRHNTDVTVFFGFRLVRPAN